MGKTLEGNLSTERTTIRLFLLYGIFNGIMNSGIFLMDVIAKKTLHASNLIITFLEMAWPIANVFSIFWGNYMEGRENKKPLFFITAFIGRLSMFLIFFIHTPLPYLFLFLLFFSFNAFLIPVQNTILQSNIKERNRGFMFGIYMSIMGLFTLISSIIFGKLLDINQFFYKPILALCGTSGFFAVLILSKIKISHIIPKKERNKYPIIISAIINTIHIFKRDKNFFIYEIAFFIYGTAFLMITPVIPHYLVNKLGMSYFQISFAKVFLAQLLVVLLAPIAGKFHDRINPALFCFFTYLILTFYPITLGAASIQHIFSPIIIVYIGYIIFSFGMSGINISWYMGTIYFSKDIDAAVLQSIHLTMTGIRGLIAPFIGYFLMQTFGDVTALFTGGIFFLTASIIMGNLSKKLK